MIFGCQANFWILIGGDNGRLNVRVGDIGSGGVFFLSRRVKTMPANNTMKIIRGMYFFDMMLLYGIARILQGEGDPSGYILMDEGIKQCLIGDAKIG